MSEWSIAEPLKLTFDDSVTSLQIRLIGGAVNVVGVTEGPARLEVTEVKGRPLKVTQQDGQLTVGYPDVNARGWRSWIEHQGWRRSAHVSLRVPLRTTVDVGVVSATAVISGITGRTTVHGVSGDTTLVGLGGPVQASTISGNVDAQAVSGDLKVNTVCGELTVVEGTGGSIKAESISGAMVLDLTPLAADGHRDTDVRLNTVSGEVAVRLPAPGNAEVDANTTSGTVSSGFDELRLQSQWWPKRLCGTLGQGHGKLRVTTVSGSVALLRRPPADEDTYRPRRPGSVDGDGQGLAEEIK